MYVDLVHKSTRSYCDIKVIDSYRQINEVVVVKRYSGRSIEIFYICLYNIFAEHSLRYTMTKCLVKKYLQAVHNKKSDKGNLP